MCMFCGDGKGLSHWGWAGFETLAVSDTPPRATSPGGSSVTPTSAAVPVSSDFEREVTFITGVNADGTISNTSYWGSTSDTAQKWGTPTAGTGASITYTFDVASAFTDTEKQTFITAMDMWEAVANVTFSLGGSNADVKLVRGATGSGANAGGPHTQGSGSTLGQNSGQWIVNMETSKGGFDLSGSFTAFNGYGLNTILHEVGHVLGLGHGGAYNGAADESTQQFSAYDERMWTSMSYIGWNERSTALYRASYDYKDTRWVDDDGSTIETGSTWMPIDILAIQRLYGASESSPFDGGDVFGFNTNITGSIAKFFDFTINTNPVITIYDEGTGNTLDLSGFADDADVDLDDGGFSSAGGLTNNIGIAFGTVIETAITGDGDDKLVGNDHDNVLDGGAGGDSFDGGAGSDTVTFVRSNEGVNIDLGRQDTHAPSGGHAEGDSFTSIENLIGSNFDDRLVAASGLGGSTIEGLKGNDTLFGSAENDTVRGGLGDDVIVGNEGNDHLYGADTNVIRNGGFEIAGGVDVGADGYSEYVGDLEGWGVLSGFGRELITTKAVEAAPFEGQYAIDLDSYGASSNTSITQVVSGAEDGVLYRLAFEAGKFDAATTARFEVYWGGTKLTWFDTHQTYVDPTVAYVTHYIDITGGAGSGSQKNQLIFAEIGAADGFGTLLDNVRMYRVEAGEPKADDWDPSSDGNDTFGPGTGSDVVFGHGGNDRATFSDIGGNDHFDGGSGVDTLVMDWHAATTAIVYRGLNVSNSTEIGMSESYERTPAVIGDSSQYLYFKEVERFELTGGTAGDTLRGGDLDDILIGNGGDDVLRGGGGVDVLNGGEGFDRATLKLSGGNNTIRLVDTMGSGSVTLGNGTQLISIEALNLEAGDGDDFLDVRGTIVNPVDDPYYSRTHTSFAGFGGNDTLAVDFATSYGATFDGGAGSSDTLIMDWSASQRDIYRNVGEDDTYRSFSHSVTVFTEGRYVTTHYYYTTTFNNVERFELTGGTGNDALAGGALDDVLKTIGGRDTLSAGAGDDLLIVDWSQIDRGMGTYAEGGGGGVPLTGSLEAGYSGIYFGDDWRYYNRVDFSGIERFDIKSADRDDGIRTGDGDDIVSSAGGNDTIDSGKGIDIIDGGGGADRWVADKSFATTAQAIAIDLNQTGVQLTYLGGATVRGIDMLSLKTGAAADTVLTLATVTANTSTHGHDDHIETNAGNDAVTVTGGRDSVAMGGDTDTLTVDWSLINRSMGSYDANGTGGVALTGSLETGYSGIYFGDDWRYYNRVDFSGVEHFVVRTGTGFDGIRTGDGNDTVSSGGGDDTIVSGKGIDVIDGGAGDDRWNADKSFATASQAIDIDLNQLNAQLTYLGGATVRGIEMLTLKTGAAADTVLTVPTITANTSTHGFDDQIETNAGNDAVTVTGGRDAVAMGADTDTLTVDWSQIGRSVGTYNSVGAGGVVLTGSLEEGYSGIFFGDDWRYYNRLDFSGVEHFVFRSGSGHDGIRTGDGNDTVISGAGNDHLITGKGIDIVDGGADVDRWEADKSFATSSQAINIDLNLSGVQLTYLGGATVRGIEMLTLKTGAGNDTIKTLATVTADTGRHGYSDLIETNDGNDAVTVTGGYDIVAMGTGTDTLTVDWSLIGRSVGTYNSVGAGGVALTGSLEEGYSGIFFGDDWRYYNRVDFSGVEHFVIRGGAGNDGIRTGDGNDTVVSGGGNDHLITGKGIDVIDGGAGDDRWDADKSFATAAQAIDIDLNRAGVQLTYLGGATVRAIDMLTLKTGAGNDTVKTLATVLTNTSTHGFDDQIETNDGNDAVTVTGGRDYVAMGTGTDTLTVDWSLISRSMGSTVLTGSLEEGYSGVYFGDDSRYQNRVDFSGVEHFVVRSGSGNDGIRTGDGNDTVISGAGNDHLLTGKGIDIVDGGTHDTTTGTGGDRWEADKSFATAGQDIVIDVTLAGLQSTYLGTGTVRGIEMLTLKTGAGNDVVRTGATVVAYTNVHGYDDQIETNDGNDAVSVGGGRDTVAMGAGTDTLTVDWSLIGRSVGTYNSVGGGGVVLTGSLETGYSGIYFGDDWRYYNRLDFSGVEHFNFRSGSGNDGIRTGDGNDTVSGGAGNDHLITGKGVDVIDGGADSDRWEADKSFATAAEAIDIDLGRAGVQLTYLGGATVRGIEMLSLKTGAGNDTVKTLATVQANTSTHGFDDLIETNDGDDIVTVTGGRDVAAMGAGSDTLIVDWSLINRGFGSFGFTGSLAEGYSGAFFGDDNRYYNRVDYSGVEQFVLRAGGANDTLRGADGDDILSGGGGDDNLGGGLGNDQLIGGLGLDVLDGGDGIDTADYSDKTTAVVVTLNGATAAAVKVNGLAEDTVRNVENVIGGTGRDILTGDQFANRLEGGGSNDVLMGGGGGDALDGGIGLDTVDYSDKTVSVALTLNGATPADVLVDGVLEDTVQNIENVIGGSAGDRLTGDQFANRLEGGAGDDVLQGGGGNDALEGGLGIDTADYSDKTESVALTLTTSKSAGVTVGGVAEDTVRYIENVIGGAGNDTITGDKTANFFRGGAGNDALDGAAGVDTADYSDKTVSVAVTLANSTAVDVLVDGLVEDSLRSIENVLGGSGNDILSGDSLVNRLEGGAGNDILKGGNGKDLLDGGIGSDTVDYSDKIVTVTLTLSGETTSVVRINKSSEDTISNFENAIGGSGNDLLTGDELVNRLEGGAGDDVLKGVGGADVLDGGDGIDTADYSDKAAAVSVTLAGATPVMVLVNGVAEDTISNVESVVGGSGNDTLMGDALANRFLGGAGNDMLEGGDGIDTADYSDKTTSVVVTLAGATPVSVTVNGVAEDTISNIENIIGGSGRDTLIGDALANRLDGGLGNDLLIGGLGSDFLDGGIGADTVDYSDRTAALSVTLNGATLAAVKVAGLVEDTLRNVEYIIGGSGNDTLIGDDLANRFEAGAGDDFLRGGGGADFMDGGAGIDTVDYSDKTVAVALTLAGSGLSTVMVDGVAEDTVRNVENVVGGSGNDTLTGSTGANRIVGGLGNDTMDGGAGIDTLDYSDRTTSVVLTLAGSTFSGVTIGGAAEDTIRNFENVIGGTGADTLTGDGLANYFFGGLGNDVLNGGAGIDTADYSDKITSVSVTLAGATPVTVKVNNVVEDTISNIENIIGGGGKDTLIGDALANRLEGGTNNDILMGGGGSDVMDGGAGIDTADYSDKTVGVSMTLAEATAVSVRVNGVVEDTISNIEQVFGGSGNDTLIGDGLANRFESGAGDDFLRGGGGIDFMDGGSGIDTADYSDKSASVSVTLAGSGLSTVTVGGVAEDTIRNVENLIGGSANDTLNGSTAANRLDGNTGSDVLMGGTGADTFVFSTALGPTNVDSILDFVAGIDKIALDDAIFTAFAGQALVGAAAFHIGSAAHDADDRIVYDSAIGSLFYDADGTGAGAATAFAVLSTGLALTQNDFLIV